MDFLVPINFIAGSHNLVDYVCSMAQATDSRVRLIHVTPAPDPHASGRKLADAMNFKLQSLAEQIVRQHGIQCDSRVRAGKIWKAIVEEAIEWNASTVVMSSYGVSPLKRFLTGSTVLKVAHHSPVPVLILPALQRGFSPLHKVVFATDYQVEEINEIKQVVSIAQPFGAAVRIVHVVNRFEEEEDDFDLDTHKSFCELLRMNIDYGNVHCEEYQYTDVAEGIRSYAEDENAQLIALSLSQKTFLERLFSANVTSEFIFHLNAPVLICSATSHNKESDVSRSPEQRLHPSIA